MISANSKIESIYFLRTGDFAVSCRICIDNLNELIEKLGGVRINTKILKQNYRNFDKYCLREQSIALYTAKDLDVIGLGDLTINGYYFVDITVKSLEAEQFIIDPKVHKML